MKMELGHIQSFLASVFDDTSDSGFKPGVTVSGGGDFGETDWQIKVRSRGSGPVFIMTGPTGTTNFKSALLLLGNGILIAEGLTDETFKQAPKDVRGNVTLEFVGVDGKKMEIDFDVFLRNRKSPGSASFSFFPKDLDIPAGVNVGVEKIVGKISLTKIRQYIDAKKGVHALFAKVGGDNIWLDKTQYAVGEAIATAVVAAETWAESVAKAVKNALEFRSDKDKEFGEGAFC